MNESNAPVEQATQAISEGNPIAVFWLVIVVLSIFLGAGENRRICVFSNYADIGLTGLSLIAPFVIVWLGSMMTGDSQFLHSVILVLGASVFLILSFMVVENTWRENTNIVYFMLALISKYTLGLIWLALLVGVINPVGDSNLKRSKSRAKSLMFLAFLTPIMLLLVKDKKTGADIFRKGLSGTVVSRYF